MIGQDEDGSVRIGDECATYGEATEVADELHGGTGVFVFTQEEMTTGILSPDQEPWSEPWSC